MKPSDESLKWLDKNCYLHTDGIVYSKYTQLPYALNENTKAVLINADNGTPIYAHHWIWYLNTGVWLDEDDWLLHKDGNGLNNDFDNLRLVTRSQSSMSRGKCKVPTTSKYKGVSWSKNSKKWIVQLKKRPKSYYGGTFHDEDEAARKYNEMALNLFGEYAALNEIKS